LDRSSGRLIGVERRQYRDLVLHERRGVAVPDAVFRDALITLATSRLPSACPLKTLQPLLSRVRTLARWRPDLKLPFTDDHQLAGLLPRLVRGQRSLADLKRADWGAAIMNTLTWPQRQALDQETPERLKLSNGRTARIRYPTAEDSRPILEARIQHLFGVTATPTLGRARHSILIHLLAPNGRPAQVTDDLAGFWTRTYPDVRRELRARYPKHAWPEDPAPS